MATKRPNGKWRARYRDAAGTEHAKHFDRKVDAERWEREQRSAVDRGVHVDPRAGRIDVQTYGERWRAAQLHHRPATVRRVEAVLRLHVYPVLGARQMSTVTRVDVQGLVNSWTATASPGTVRSNWYPVLSAVFRAAVDDGVIGKSPCARIRLPEVVAEQVHPLTTAQVMGLIDAVDPAARPAVVVGAGLGVRISEALGITRDRVRFLKREIMIDRQQGPHPPYPLVPLKNSRSTPFRVVPAPQWVLEALSTPEAHPEFDGRMFVRPDGRLLTAQAVGKAVTAAVKEAGLPAGTTFHDLRHFYASTLIDGGESVVVVAARLGDTVAETLKTYAHMWPDDAERTRKIMDGIFDADRVGSAPPARKEKAR